MSWTWQILSLVGLSVMVDSGATAQSRSRIEFANRTPEGLVGNGHSVVKVQPAGYRFHTGGDGSARFRLVVDGVAHEFITATDAHALFFPGGVVYALTWPE